MDIKQIIVFRKDLFEGEHAIGQGEFASQVASASMLALFKSFAKERCDYQRMGPYGYVEPNLFFTRYSLEFKDGTLLDNWLNKSFKKVVVGVESEKELLELEQELKWLNEHEYKMIPYALVKDDDASAFHGVPTFACLGIGPYNAEELNDIISDLPLL